jgi:glycosyltransferase involved in cell wall biosynthesis
MPDKNPLVSIGLPVYNGEKFIRRALESLISQSYEHFEIIISDNASTDRTPEICREYMTRDKRIRYLRNPKNIGALSNFKRVLELAQGDYFMWAADDDFWLPDFIKTLLEELENHIEAGVAMSAVDRIWENGTALDSIRFTGRNNPNVKSFFQMLTGIISPKLIKYNFYIYGLYRTSLLKKAIPLFPDVPLGDRLFICQIALATRFRYVDQMLHIRTHHFKPSTARLPNERFNKMLQEKFVLLKSNVAFGKMLLRSSIIPWYRKIYIPLAVILFSLIYWRSGFHRFLHLCYRSYCPQSIQTLIKKYLMHDNIA